MKIFTKPRIILICIVGFIFYLAVMIMYLLSVKGVIAFTPGQLNSITIADQSVDTQVTVSHVTFRNKNGGYIVFQRHMRAETSPKISSQYFKPGDYRNVTVYFENQENNMKDVFVPGEFVSAILYEKEDLEQYHLQNWRFPLRDLFGNAVTVKFLVH
jgi:hypothetical protein